MGSSRRHLPNIVLYWTEGPGRGREFKLSISRSFFEQWSQFFFSNALVLTEFLGSGGIYKKILRFDVSRGLRSQKTPFLSHFTREFGQKLRAIALGGPTTPKSKISSQIIYKCTKPLIPSVKFRGHRTFFPCNKSRLKWRNWDQLLTEYSSLCWGKPIYISK